MIPKVEACLETLDHGVRKIHIIDGRLRHSLLLEIYTNKGVGTEIDARSVNRCKRGFVILVSVFKTVCKPQVRGKPRG